MLRNPVEQQSTAAPEETARPAVEIADLSLDEQTQWILDHNPGMPRKAAEMIPLVMFNHLRLNRIPAILHEYDGNPTDEAVWGVLVNDPNPGTSLFKIHEFDKYEIGDFFKSWMKSIRLQEGL
jgi:hypothetical protein